MILEVASTYAAKIDVTFSACARTFVVFECYWSEAVVVIYRPML